MQKIVLATHNKDKLKEFLEVLKDLPYKFMSLYDIPDFPAVVEDGDTLEANSLKKAKELSSFTGYPALADDTGLFVDVLNGAPGVFSARFAGKNCSYRDNVNKLLNALKEIPFEQRTATFKTVVTIVWPKKSTVQFWGIIEGHITTNAIWDNGFGYDPIFLPSGKTRVFSEISVEEKNSISHRGQALKQAQNWLYQQKGSGA